MRRSRVRQGSRAQLGLSFLCLASLASANIASSDNITSTFYASSKRGLVFVPNSDFPEDNNVWVQNGSDLTWYYNYKPYPSSNYAKDTSLGFVPMLWGAPPSFNDTTFLDNVTAQITHGSNITHVMGFNEPDGSSDTGGSEVPPDDAAIYWVKQIQPLKKLGVQLGAPAVTGGESGFTWLANFTKACGDACTFDFIPIHWYGNFDGLQNHLADVANAYPGVHQWVTEFALDNEDLNTTQQFFQDAVRYLDKNE